MATFDTLIDDLGSRYGVGANARSLVREILAMISSSPGSLGGFLDKLKSAGLSSEVASWLGRPDAGPIAAGQVERALGATALSGIASRVGLGQDVVSTALGYALPKIVGLLTPGGAVPAGVPAEVTAFLSQPRAAAAIEQVAPKRIDVLPASAESEPAIRRWLWPALAALVVVGLLSYFWSTMNRIPPAPVAKAPEPTMPAPATVAQAPPPSCANGASANSAAPRANACAAGPDSGSRLNRRAGHAPSTASACPRDESGSAASFAARARSLDGSTSDVAAACPSTGGASARHTDFASDDRPGARHPGSCDSRNR